MKVLILGSGGREHALAWRMSQDPSTSQIFIWPGNDGMKDKKLKRVTKLFSQQSLRDFIETEKIDLVVPGSEQYLYDGVADICQSLNTPCFGPGAMASQLEKSKLFAKKLMVHAKVPTARFLDLTEVMSKDINEACLLLKTFKKPVIKISGPSLGKGVFVCEDYSEASEVLRKLQEAPQPGMEDGILVEEGVSGKEVSMFFACSDLNFRYLGSAQDHKRVFDGDKGPNTGGMGAVSPVPWVNRTFVSDITERFVVPTLKAMHEKGHPFKGVLFLGLMVDDSEINLLEYNVRFGDPETQALLPLIEGDFTQFLHDFSAGSPQTSLTIRNQISIHVVKAAAGYPGTFGTPVEKGQEIHLKDEKWDTGKLFFAGVKEKDQKLVTNGGRVLGVTSWGDTFTEVRNNCYAYLSHVHFQGEHFRKDIGRNL